MNTMFSNKHHKYFIYDKVDSQVEWSFMKKQNSSTMFYIITTLVIIIIGISLSGCSEADINAEQNQCTQQNKKYIVEKQLNYRTGEFVYKGKCVEDEK